MREVFGRVSGVTQKVITPPPLINVDNLGRL